MGIQSKRAGRRSNTESRWTFERRQTYTCKATSTCQMPYNHSSGVQHVHVSSGHCQNCSNTLHWCWQISLSVWGTTLKRYSLSPSTYTTMSSVSSANKADRGSTAMQACTTSVCTCTSDSVTSATVVIACASVQRSVLDCQMGWGVGLGTQIPLVHRFFSQTSS